MEEYPRQSSHQSTYYTQIALYAAGNALSLALFLILYQAAAVLADFRDPMLYAFLCSIALRGPKDWIVTKLESSLSHRSLIMAIAAPPYLAIKYVWMEVIDAFESFRFKVKEIQEDYQHKMAQQVPQLQQHQRLVTLASVYAKAGIRTLTSRKERRKKKHGTKHHARPSSINQDPSSNRNVPSFSSSYSSSSMGNRLLICIVVICILWTVYEWIRDTWSPLAHVILLTAIISGAFTCILWSFLNVIHSWQPNLWSRLSFPGVGSALHTKNKSTPIRHPPRGEKNSAPHSPQCANGSHASSSAAVTTTATTTTTTTTTTRAAAANVKTPPPHRRNTLHAHTTVQNSPRNKTSLVQALFPESPTKLHFSVMKGFDVLESPFRHFIKAHVHTLVTFFLIAGLLIGTAGTAAFVTVRVVDEARGALVAGRDAFPAAWAGVAAATPFLSDTLPDSRNGEGGSDDTSSRSNGSSRSSSSSSNMARGSPRSLQEVASNVQLPPWLAAYQKDALDFAQKSLPGVITWMEGHINSIMQQHNLTDALGDARLLYETAQGPRRCSQREKTKLLVTLAKAELAVHEARQDCRESRNLVEESQELLMESTAQLEHAMGGGDEKTLRGSPKNTIENSKNTNGKDTATTTTTADNSEDSALKLTQHAVVDADARLRIAKAAHTAAAAKLDDAERSHRIAHGRLQLCTMNTKIEHQESESSVLVGAEIGRKLQSAYTTLFWEWKLIGGVSKLYAAVSEALQSVVSQPGSTADLSRLQQLAQSAAVPLIAVAKAGMSSVGTTTAAAVMGSVGLFRLGLSVFHLGVQAILFLTLLYYLLADQTDPLSRAVSVLPLPVAARHRAAAAINAALGGVFMSLLKLAAFHGLFTYISYRMMRIPLVYTSASVSAAFALLPFVPPYFVAVPACLIIALLQGRVAAAIVLFVLHFFAYYMGDTVILEDTGGHPFMMSLAILGGMWAFPNPLLGCLLGPIILSLLSALGHLHTELMMGSGMFLSLSPMIKPRGRGEADGDEVLLSSLMKVPAEHEAAEEGEESDLDGEKDKDAASSSVSTPTPREEKEGGESFSFTKKFNFSRKRN